jgi:hypothetical protein
MIESAQITRWAVLAALSLATGVMFAVSMRGNYLFGYSLGQSDEKRELFGWANVAADVWKAFGLIAVSVLWRTKRRQAACVASLAWLICLLFGVNSALGIYVQDRATLTGSREAMHSTYKEAAKELALVEEKLRGLARHRSIGEVEAAISAVLGRAVLTGERVRGTVAAVSQNCTKIDTRTYEACREVAQLREEHAVATQAEIFEARASGLRDQVATLRDRGGSIASDPVGEFYAWLTRGSVSVRDVGFGFPLFFALLIEVVSAFGPFTIAAYAEASRRITRESDSAGLPEPAVASHGELRPAAPELSEPEAGQVVSWIAERAAPAAGNSAIGIEELHADYALWCRAGGLHVTSIALFEQELDRVRELPDLAGKIRKFGDRYYGVGLVRKDMGALTSGRSG